MKQLLMLLLAFQLVSYGQKNDSATEQTAEESLQRNIKKLKIKPPQTGTNSLSNGAEVVLPEGYVYYDAQSGNKILQDWGNPPSTTSGPQAFQGLIFSGKYTLMGEPGLTISVDSNTMGFISDEDADDYDYDDILESLQESAEASNEARKQQGYSTIKIIGWAAKPSYDKQSKKLYFAKELQFDGSSEHTLNYDIHVLGRRGFVKLSFIGGMSDLSYVEKERSEILTAVNYKKGYKYSEFKEGDKVAESDFGSLLTGGNIAIAGGILAVLLKFKKLLIIGVLAIGAFIGKIFKRQEA